MRLWTIVGSILLVVALGCGGAGAPESVDARTDQALGYPSICNPYTDPTIAASSLGAFTPQPYVDSATGTLELYAVTTLGLSVRRFYSKGWHSWRSYGLPPSLPAPAPTNGQSAGWDAALTVRPRPDGTRDAWFGFVSGQGAAVARNHIDLSPSGTLQASIVVPPSGYMSTVAGVGSGDGEKIFGTPLPNSVLTDNNGTIVPIEELENGRPRLLPTAGTAFSRQIVGPGGVVSIRPNPTQTQTDDTFVFAGDGFSGFRNQQGAHVPIIDGGIKMLRLGDASWTSLGAPPGAGAIAAAPFTLAFYWGDPAAGAPGRMNVFVTARDDRGSQYRLWENPSIGGGFPGWKTYDAPPGVGFDDPFALTTAMVWWDGAQYASTLRTNMFGLTSSGKLIEFFFDGSYWHWGQVIPTAPDGAAFAGLSSAVIDTGSYKRLSLIARTAAGTVFEYAYTIDNGVWSGWTWTNLSVVQPCTIYVF
jgi:hypothetical protein